MKISKAELEKRAKSLKADIYEAALCYFPEEKHLKLLIEANSQSVEKYIIDQRWKGRKKFTKIDLRYKDWCNGLSFAQLATKYNVSEAAIKKSVSRARAKLIGKILTDIQNGIIKRKSPESRKENAALKEWESIKQRIATRI